MSGFYKANGKVGSTVLFWAINGRGYVSDLDKAEMFTKEEAQADIDNGWLRDNDEFPLSVDRVNELAEWRIDHQYVEKTYPEFTDPNDEYVVYKTNFFDGNDLAFGVSIGWGFDYSKANTYSHEDADCYVENKNPNMVFVPKCHADEIAKLLGYARRSLINMARNGKIPPTVVYQKKKYGSWKVNLEEWDKWELTR